MPIEINEVHVRVTVNEAGAGDAPPSSVVASTQSGPAPEKMLEQSVEQILQILRDKKER